MPYANEQLTAYLDGELTSAERADVEAQLATDPEMQAELDALTGVRDFLMDHGAMQAPSGFLEDVLAAVEDEPVVKLAWYRRPMLGVPVSGLAVAAAALLVIYVALPGAGPDPVTTTANPDRTGAGAAKIEPLSSGSYGGWDAKETPKKAVAAPSDLKRDSKVLDALAKGAPISPDEIWSPDKSETPKEVDKDTLAKGVNEKLSLPGTVGGLDGEVAKGLAADAPEPTLEGVATQAEDFSRVPYSYTVFTEDEEVLLRLASIAAKHRGLVTESNDQPLQIEQLAGNDTATVVVKLPAHALQDFSRELDGLGSVRATADNTMFAGDPVEVRISVRLAGGAPASGAADSKPASRRATEAADEVLEAH